MFRLESLAPGVSMVEGRAHGSHSYLLEAEADRVLVVDPVIVDAGDNGAWRELFARLKGEGLSPVCVLTHLHVDHAQYTNVHPARSNVPVLGPKRRQPYTSVERLFLPDPEPIGRELFGWRVLETPGHAPEHVCLFRGGVLIAGDMAGRREVTDEGAFEASRALLTSLSPSLVLSGHAPPSGQLDS